MSQIRIRKPKRQRRRNELAPLAAIGPVVDMSRADTLLAEIDRLLEVV